LSNTTKKPSDVKDFGSKKENAAERPKEKGEHTKKLPGLDKTSSHNPPNISEPVARGAGTKAG